MAKKTRANKRIGVYIGLCVLLITATAGGFWLLNRADSKQSNSVETETINYAPPTEEEASEGDQQKEEIIEQEDAVNNAESQTPNIVIVDASQYDDVVEVRAYVSNIYEDNGECKVTFSRNGQTVSKTSNAFKDARNTQCQPFDIPRSEFPTPGDWRMTLAYSSSTTSGTAPTKTVTIN